MSYSKALRMSRENADKVWDAEKKEWVAPPNKTTYKVWFKITGEPKWVTAFKEWDTYDEGFLHGVDKFMSWTATEQYCVVKTGIDPNETKGE